MAKKHLTLQHSESVVIQAAAQIYAAYIISGRVSEEGNAQWLRKAISEAIAIAEGVDDAVISDGEME